MKRKFFVLMALVLLVVFSLYSTNITVENIEIVDRNDAEQYVVIQFDLGWDYGFRVDDDVNSNWDAAWIFIKYKDVGDGNVQWGHATLHSTGHTIPGGFTSTLGGNKGIFIYSAANFNGTVNLNGVRLRWNYGDDGLDDEDVVDIKVFGIEMVYVPGANFLVGSGGTETERFYSVTGGDPTPFNVATTPINFHNSAGNLWADGAVSSGVTHADYPLGRTDFYVMKHGITQQAYVDFLNTLDYAQQDARTAIAPNAGVNAYLHDDSRHAIYIETNGVAGTTPAVYATDNVWVACGFLSSDDLLAYLDWAALRPYTELEYERAARGPLSPVANEYAWGNLSIGAVTTISGAGLSTETAMISGVQRDITILASKVDATLTNFPVFIKLDDSNFDFDLCDNNGHSVRFFDVLGNELDYQRQRHDKVAEKAEYWINVPSISHTQNTVISMQYSTDGAVDYETADMNDVWNDDFVSVWHLTEDGEDAGPYIDIKNSHHGNWQALTYPTQIEGIIGQAQEFDKEHFIGIDHHADFDITENITISAWIKAQSLKITEEYTTAADWNDNHSMDDLETDGDNLIIEDGNDLSTGESSGLRISNPIDLDDIKNLGDSNIDWTDERGYVVVEFDVSGDWIVPAGVTEVDVLVVAGGGGGGRSATPNASGGGGAGGVIYETNYSVTPSSSITVVVGEGGSPGDGGATVGENGGNSSFDDVLIAVGGGRGGQNDVGPPDLRPGASGGSGGGAATSGGGGGTAEDEQGNAGGDGQGGAGGGAGGGGAGASGANASGNNGGNGGSGSDYSSIFGSTYGDDGWFAGGGGGGANTTVATAGSGGKGGGGNAALFNVDDPDAMPNTGGGGGAGSAETANEIGGAGGSGIVLIRYKSTAVAQSGTVKVYAAVNDDPDTPPEFTQQQVFTGDDTWTVPAGVTSVQVLVVGGGGAGGDHTTQATQTGAGGGGAGEIVYESSYAVTPGDPITVEVGAGGNVVINNRGESGQSSSFGTLTAAGGGGGGFRNNGDGLSGGSGGGAGYTGSPGIGTATYGNDGGSPYDTNPYLGGGGGGADETGDNATVSQAGHGGDGIDYSHIFGTAVGDNGVFAGGGGGGNGNAGAGAYGSGGDGGGGRGGQLDSENADAGLANTGGGGGGAGEQGSSGGAGGSGVVIVKWNLSCTKGDPIPVLTEGEDYSGKYLWVAQKLNVNTSGYTPVLKDLELEIKPEATIFGKSKDTYQLSIADDQLKAYINDSVLTPYDVLTHDKYYHVALRYNITSEIIRLFINGVPVNPHNVYDQNIDTNLEDLIMGENLMGELDEIRISNVARSNAWIKAEYFAGTGDLIHIGGEGSLNNAIYGNELSGPMRVGFGSTPTSARTSSGASYWGIMELSGNLWERTITIGNNDGRGFTGLHGDGQLDASGNFNVANWNKSGFGFRGGAFDSPNANPLRVSDREKQNDFDESREPAYGGRGARTTP